MTKYKNILVAIDFSEATSNVIKRAVAAARQNDANMTLMHVVEYIPPPDIAYETSMSPDWGIDEGLLVKNAEAKLDSFCAKHELGNIRQAVSIGTPKYEICQYAREHGCDLIVMGAHGLHGIRLLLGSTTNGVLHEMPCDVLAVKAGE